MYSYLGYFSGRICPVEAQPLRKINTRKGSLFSTYANQILPHNNGHCCKDTLKDYLQYSKHLGSFGHPGFCCSNDCPGAVPPGEPKARALPWLRN